jgi:hypothetical protein
MPSMAIDRLTADTTGAMSTRERCFTIGRGRAAEVSRKPVASVDIEGPRPPRWRAASARESAREVVGAKRMSVPVSADGLRKAVRHVAARQGIAPHDVWKGIGDLVEQEAQSLLIAAITPARFRHPAMKTESASGCNAGGVESSFPRTTA